MAGTVRRATSNRPLSGSSTVHPASSRKAAKQWRKPRRSGRSQGWSAPATAAATAGAAGAATGGYYTRNTQTSSTRYRSYRRDTGNGPGETSYRASGVANETIGNVKQGIGNVTGNESLRQSGLEQERKGEAQHREGDRRGDRGNEF